MTNEEIQKIINIGDMCHIDGHDDDLYKFVGFEDCQWQKRKSFHHTPDPPSTCSRCKGTMKFIFNDEFMVGCHSHADYANAGTNWQSDITIIQKNISFLTEELFEI